jgi:hypothetical protein
MKWHTISAFGLAIAVACGTMAYAQDSDSMGQHPKVLQITREFEKPGKGPEHDKTEGAFVAALRKGNVTMHYFSACSVTGKPRCLYFAGFDSYASWEMANKAMMADKNLAAEMTSATTADSELLESTEEAAFSYSKGLSYKDDADIAHARYIEVDSYRVKPGHFSDFMELVNMIKDANDKAGTSMHWSAYHLDFGGDPEIVNFFTADKSMADLDKEIMDGDKFWEKLGEDGRKRYEELYARAVADEVEQLLAINPAQSYPPDSWVKADPEFWTVKTESAPAVKAKEKKK